MTLTTQSSNSAADRSPAPGILSSSRGPVLLLVSIAALALALRVFGLGFGLPAIYNQDEISIMARALGFAKGDLNPHNFLYPTLYFYVLFGWVGAYFLGAWLTGAVSSLAAFQASFFTDPSSIYLAGRSLGVACAVLTVLLTYVATRRLFGPTAGLAAALFLAVAPVHVIDSHYVKHDVAVTLAIVTAELAVLSVWPLGERRPLGTGRAAFAGALCGLAFSVHYYAVFLAAPLALAVFFATRAAGWQSVGRRLAEAAAGMAAGFLVCSPFILVEPRTAWRDIVANRQIVVDRAVASGGSLFASAGRYLQMLWLDATGWPVIVLAVIGLGLVARRSPRRALLLVAFPVPFLLFVSNTVAASRYLNPVLPWIALFAGYAVAEFANVLKGGARTAAATILALLAASPGCLQSARADAFFRQTDTRTLARQFIEERIPAGAGVALQPYSVPLTPTRGSLVEALRRNLGSLDRLPRKFALQLDVTPFPEPAYRLIFIGDGGLDLDKLYVSYRELGGQRGLGPLRSLGIEYVVLKRFSDSNPVTRPFIDALEREARLVTVFSPYPAGTPSGASAPVEPYLHNTDARIQPPLLRPGPVIEIWQLDHAGDGAETSAVQWVRPGR